MCQLTLSEGQREKAASAGAISLFPRPPRASRQSALIAQDLPSLATQTGLLKREEFLDVKLLGKIREILGKSTGYLKVARKLGKYCALMSNLLHSTQKREPALPTNTSPWAHQSKLASAATLLVGCSFVCLIMSGKINSIGALQSLLACCSLNLVRLKLSPRSAWPALDCEANQLAWLAYALHLHLPDAATSELATAVTCYVLFIQQVLALVDLCASAQLGRVVGAKPAEATGTRNSLLKAAESSLSWLLIVGANLSVFVQLVHLDSEWQRAKWAGWRVWLLAFSLAASARASYRITWSATRPDNCATR